MAVATGFFHSALGSKTSGSGGELALDTTHYLLHNLPEGAVPGLTSCLVQEISQKAAHDGLVTDDQHILLTLQLHDHRLQSLHQVLVGLSCKTNNTIINNQRR